jgi:hypothetical protein
MRLLSHDSGVPLPFRAMRIHEKTGEKRAAVIPGGPANVAAWDEVWRKAFVELGLLDFGLKRQQRVRLVSARRSQAWPIFTKIVIPRLYDLLAPFYRKRSHVWSDKEEVLKRDAFSPKELLEDMRDILQLVDCRRVTIQVLLAGWPESSLQLVCCPF